jgi:hypothetical protein
MPQAEEKKQEKENTSIGSYGDRCWRGLEVCHYVVDVPGNGIEIRSMMQEPNDLALEIGKNEQRGIWKKTRCLKLWLRLFSGFLMYGMT